MPSLKEATTKPDLSNYELVATPPTPPTPPSRGGSNLPGNSPLTLAPLPVSFGSAPDFQRGFYVRGTSQQRIPPLPVQASTAVGASAKSQAIVEAATSGPSVDLQVNGVDNPIQTKANFTGTGVRYGPGPGQINITGGSGDGLIHGDPIWVHDSAYIELRDDFLSGSGITNSGSDGTVPRNEIGQLGWMLCGTIGSSFGGINGGGFPYIGQMTWTQNGSASAAAFLVLQTNGRGSAHNLGSWPLGDTAGWKKTWVFKLDGDFVTGVPFSSAQKAIYIGLVGSTYPAMVNSFSRPDVFVGLRFDTSTTSPIIDDSFFTFEAVANSTTNSPARNNTQGTTFVTTVAPVAGVWHRLDIVCTTIGTVVMTLDGSSTNTFTVAIPTFSLTSSASGGSGSITSGQAQVGWSVSSSVPDGVWDQGSVVTISGFTAGRSALNGVQILGEGLANNIYWDTSHADISFGNDTITIAGRPALQPFFQMGNDDTSSPQSNSMTAWVDYFSFIWNPGVISLTAATPDPTKPRYF